MGFGSFSSCRLLGVSDPNSAATNEPFCGYLSLSGVQLSASSQILKDPTFAHEPLKFFTLIGASNLKNQVKSSYALPCGSKYQYPIVGIAL